MRPMMARATESECRTPPSFCGRFLRTAPTSHADLRALLQIARWSILIVFSARDVHVSFILEAPALRPEKCPQIAQGPKTAPDGAKGLLAACGLFAKRAHNAHVALWAYRATTA
jgi:hypothetical protein